MEAEEKKPYGRGCRDPSMLETVLEAQQCKGDLASPTEMVMQ